MNTLQEKLARWEAELARLRAAPSRWGETRRFAGRSAGNRLARIDWITARITDAKIALGLE